MIPLLLVALGVEAGFFQRVMREPAPRSMAITTIFVLCIGEVLALSALPKSGKGCGDVLYEWHEYIAFIFTLEACFVALVTLVWVLIEGRALENKDGAVPVHAQPNARTSITTTSITTSSKGTATRIAVVVFVVTFVVGWLRRVRR